MAVPLQTTLQRAYFHQSLYEMSNHSAYKTPLLEILASCLSGFKDFFLFFFLSFNSSLDPSKQQCYNISEVSGFDSKHAKRQREGDSTGEQLNLFSFSPQHHCEIFLQNIRFKSSCHVLNKPRCVIVLRF